MRLKPCLARGCDQYVGPGSSYCPRHIKSRHAVGLTGAGRSAAFHRNRRVVLHRQHGRCAICGSTVGLQVHHIGAVTDDSISNLVALCSDCHRDAHRRDRLDRIARSP
jgi:5-methylcytosine-specific restriction endonuclease McrA